MTRRLYGISLSPFVRKVRAVLSLKAIDYELVSVMPGAMDESFRSRSPLSKIPVWEEDDFTLPDSSVICAYLEKKHPTPSVFPADPEAFGRALFWEEYADTRMMETVGPIFFERVVSSKVFQAEPNEDIVRRQVEEVLPPIQDQVQRLFIESGVAVAPGGDVSIADLSIWSAFVNLEHAGVAIDAERWPALAGFVDHMNQREPLRALVVEERASLESR